MARLACLGLVAVCGIVAYLLPSTGSEEFHGRVTGPYGPLNEALVRIQASEIQTRTDANGRFRLPGRRYGGRLTAAKMGFFIGRSSTSTIFSLRPIPAIDNEEYEWVDPLPGPAEEHRCANCHSEIFAEWQRGAHSRSAINRRFRNLYEGTDWHGQANVGWSLLGEHPHGAAVCASCHAPTIHGEDPALFDLREVKGIASRGVHCDYCHKVQGLNEGEIGLSHGRYLHKLVRPMEGQIVLGPLDDGNRDDNSYSSFYRDSRYCAACHEGVVFGVRVYSTYSEWLQSPARQVGLHCQHCHMKPTGAMTNAAPRHGGIERNPSTLGNHLFWEGSQLDMLRRSLRPQIETSRDGKGVRVRVRLLATGVGHRVPTGFIDKHLLLIVQGQDKRGQPMKLLAGPVLPSHAGQELAGQPGKLYGRLPRDVARRSPVPFWKALPDMEDTRLMPEVPDQSTYEFAPDLTRIRVQLLHRRYWDEVSRRKRWPGSDLRLLDREIDLSK